MVPQPLECYKIPVYEEGKYKIVFNTDDMSHGGSGYPTGAGDDGLFDSVAEEFNGKPYHLVMNLPPLAGICFMLVKVPEEQKNISALNDSEASKIVPEVQKKDMVKTVSSAEHTKASHKKKGHSGVTKPSVNSSVSGEKTDNNNKNK